MKKSFLSSPKLFNLYINGLIAELSSMRVGCWIDNVCVNNLSYADDMVLLGPTAGAVRKLLRVCERYANSLGLVYNVKKSVYLVFETADGKVPQNPVLTLNGLPLARVHTFKYLGHFLTSDLRDEVDIDRKRRALAVRGNILWMRHTKRSLDALRVQYNNCFRMLLGLPSFCSASGMFASTHTDDFHAIMRKKIYSTLSRARSSSNNLLKTLSEKYDDLWLSHVMKVLVRRP
ncbi:uncharacterized protein LOC124632024 [Helicoverpa zea]|uniref:uncharacterized protein LOC124632024 n=1 Tax=Helicoverpa zea TaxID=7113 RepID=UPI001F58E769|nr:uncharacterized protein LOC124632024 [Helicoverpa zea]